MNKKIKIFINRKYNKQKGFNLIELLAVILILGIIALIAVPTITNLIDESKREAFKSTLNNIEKKVEETCTLEKIKNMEINTHYVITNGVSNPTLDIKGELPDGDIYVDSQCNVTYTLSNKDFIGTKNDPQGEVVISIYNKTLIEKSTDKAKSYVGYYADVDGDRMVDGVIFLDLITGRTSDSNYWVNCDGSYDISPSSDPSIYKDYYIVNNYEGDFGTKPVISLAKNSKGEDRFYVLALDDISSSNYYWYYSAHGKMTDNKTYTSKNFGSGLKNTTNMITKWNNSGYGEKRDDDMWGVIGDYVDKGWFVPSTGEWAAFGKELAVKNGITGSNFAEFGLSNGYWSSSQYGIDRAYFVNFKSSYVYGSVESVSVVRLATTF